MFLLKASVLDGKYLSFIDFPFFDNLTFLSELSVFIQHLFLGADIVPMFIIVAVSGSNLFYGFVQIVSFCKDKLDGQRSSLNGRQMKEKVFMSKLLQMILNGISLVNYINGSQIHMRICHCRN